jgi:hypothetical protein
MKQRMKKPVKESMDNIQKVVNGDTDVVATVDVVTADAIDANNAAVKHKEEVEQKLFKMAEEGGTPSPNPEYGKMKENTYTKRYTLDESLQDFKLSDAE